MYRIMAVKDACKGKKKKQKEWWASLGLLYIFNLTLSQMTNVNKEKGTKVLTLGKYLESHFKMDSETFLVLTNENISIENQEISNQLM